MNATTIIHEGFTLWYLQLKGRIRGSHPGFKKPVKATVEHLEMFDGFERYSRPAFLKAVESFNDGKFHMGAVKDFYSVSNGPDHLILLPSGADPVKMTWFWDNMVSGGTLRHAS